MIDPRAKSSEKIKPPHPLPLVSRSALKRVKDYMPPPTLCPYCNGPVSLVSNDAIYGRQYGKWPYAYLCRPCDAHVGLHPATDLPLGTLANGELREARKRSKSAFIVLMSRRGWERSQAYAWLSGRMGIPVKETHFGMFDLERARMAGAVCVAALRGEK